MAVKAQPDGYNTVTPYLLVESPDKVADFLQHVFDAQVVECIKSSDGAAKHCEIKMGDSMVMIGASRPDAPSNNTMLYVYVNDTDATYKKALDYGAQSLMEPSDQFYGDRNAGVLGPGGNHWWIATHIEDLSSEELHKRSREYHEGQH